MSLIDFILNIAGLLLWLNWLSLRLDPLARSTPNTLVGTLRKAGLSRGNRWMFLDKLALLLLIRALIYWEIGPAVDWTPSLRLIAVSLPFRSDYLAHMLLFSVLGFILTLGIFYLWLLLLSVTNGGVPDTDPQQKLVRLHLGRVERWPWLIKLALPLLVGALFWMALQPVLAHLGIAPHTKSLSQRFAQSLVIGLAGYVGWKYLIIGILLLHLLNSYVIWVTAGWNFINATARHLLAPLSPLPLKIGRVDFAPVAGIALIFLLTEALPLWIPPGRYLPF